MPGPFAPQLSWPSFRSFASPNFGVLGGASLQSLRRLTNSEIAATKRRFIRSSLLLLVMAWKTKRVVCASGMELAAPCPARPGFRAFCDRNPKITLPQTAKCGLQSGYTARGPCLADGALVFGAWQVWYEPMSIWMREQNSDQNMMVSWRTSKVQVLGCALTHRRSSHPHAQALRR